MKPVDAYIVSPVEFPEYAAGIAKNWKPRINKVRDDLYFTGSDWQVELFHLSSRLLLANAMPFDPRRVLNSLCKIGNAVRIKGGLGQVSWYLHHLSWRVFGWGQTDPEEGGDWVPEPLFDFPLESCA